MAHLANNTTTEIRQIVDDMLSGPVPTPTEEIDSIIQSIALKYLRYIDHDSFPLLLAEKCRDMLSAGFRRDIFDYAIERTALAPRPSAQYMHAILRRLEREKRYTFIQAHPDPTALSYYQTASVRNPDAPILQNE